MSPSRRAPHGLYEERTVEGPDAATRYLRLAIIFAIIAILSLLLYALVIGVFGARPPQTFAEASANRAEAAVAATPGSGKAWAALASSRWAEGDDAGAWEAVEQAKTSVEDHSLLYVQNLELEFLLAEERNQEAYDLAVEYLTAEEAYRLKEAQDYTARGIVAPDSVPDLGETIRLYLMKAAAAGNLEKWSDAIASLDVALELDPEASDILTLRGWAHFRSGDNAAAKADFQQALRYIPDYASALEGLASVEASSAP